MKTDVHFSLGDLVCVQVDSTRVGPIIEVLSPESQTPRYRVFHSATNIAEYYGVQLMLCPVVKGDPLWGATDRREFVTAEVFLARLTAARLAHHLTDTLYALASARIQFIPFQFKPLLRLLRADRPRLLIADEVGVGKTIEAGLILTELKARQKLENVLVVCPKALVGKWQKELRRFDERFKILDSKGFQFCLKETHLEGEWPEECRRAIVPLEVIRRTENFEGDTGKSKGKGLLQLTSLPSFDLLIVDEAHHLRNPSTGSHRVARFLCEVSTAAVFLSATPVHVGSENLFSLLSLLRPDLFLSKDSFADMMEPARHLLQASRCARANKPDWVAEVLSHLQLAAKTGWGASVLTPDPVYKGWINQLQASTMPDDNDRVRCLRDVEELHPLRDVLNRTRRRDIGRFTLREPHTVAIEFSPAQQEFYTQLIDFRRKCLMQKHDPLVVRLILDTLERQATSCLPALAATLETFLQGAEFWADSVADAWDEYEECDLRPDTTYLQDAIQELRDLADAVAKQADPKFARFEEILSQSVGRSSTGPGKVLVFSFFLNTLHYLRTKLVALGYRVELITGKVADLEREQFRERFSLPRDHAQAIDVLLSSEVGCEGLDYQFCDRMVNYDIPWNPMRIEQRIGRIDRYGQESEKVLIFNFITPGTVEERIFFRCFERLGVFNDTVGDLEGVLGTLTHDLTVLSMDGSLTAQQQDEKTKQLEDNALRIVEEQRRLEDEGQLLLGSGSQMEPEVSEFRSPGRYVDPQQLHRMIQLYLKQQGKGSFLTDLESGNCRLSVSKEFRATIFEKLGSIETTTSVIEFRRALEQPGNPEMTFDQSVALSRRDLMFVTPVHPLARIAVQHWECQPEQLVGCLKLPENLGVRGPLLFLLELWESVGVRKQIQLVGRVWNLELQREEVEIGQQLVSILSQSSAQENPLVTERIEGWKDAYTVLEQRLAQQRQCSSDELRQRNEVLVERQLVGLDAYFRNRLEHIEQDLRQVSEDRIVRMKQSERERVRLDYNNQKLKLQENSKADIIPKRLAMGLLV